MMMMMMMVMIMMVTMMMLMMMMMMRVFIARLGRVSHMFLCKHHIVGVYYVNQKSILRM